MKGCMVLQRRFAYIGHELAVSLREKGIVDEFCAYVQTRDSYEYLKGQHDIEYTGLILDEDIQKSYKNEILDLHYLEALEREYGMPNVWRFINVDRIMRYSQHVREYPYDRSRYSHEELLRIVQVFGKRICAFLDAEKPDFIFMYQPGALGTVLLYAIAKKRGIPVIVNINPVTRDLIALSEKYDRLTWVEEEVRKYSGTDIKTIPQYKEAVRFIEEFRNAPKVYTPLHAKYIRTSRISQLRSFLPQNIVRALRWYVRVIVDKASQGERRTDYSTVKFTHYFIDRVRRAARNILSIDDFYDKFDPNVPFAFYAAHLEPEIAVMLLAPFDTDQVHIIKRLASSLPVGMLLYVKEHPHMVQYRPRIFYRELKKIPNVRLMRPDVSSFDLIQNSKLVATISGGAGWEATIFGKPVITFGEVFYNALESVAHSRIPDELPDLVMRQLEKRIGDNDLIRYIAALFSDCARGDLLHIWEEAESKEKRREALASMAEILGKKIQQATSAISA